MKIIFSDAAQIELEETVLYYETQKEGLGESFNQTIKDAIEKLTIFPEAHMQVSPNIRRVVLSKFTYNIFYNYSNDMITIISIAHQHKKPIYTYKEKQCTNKQ